LRIHTDYEREYVPGHRAADPLGTAQCNDPLALT
jgi:hypothetical protein